MNTLEEVDEIELLEVIDENFLTVTANPIKISAEEDSIFGLPTRYDTDFPMQLMNVVPEQVFIKTMFRINSILEEEFELTYLCYMAGVGMACCTLGASVIPSFMLIKKTVAKIRDVLEEENREVYVYFNVEWTIRKIRSIWQENKYAIFINYYQN